MEMWMLSLGATIISAITWAVKKEAHLDYLEKRQDRTDGEVDKIKDEVKDIGEKLVGELSKIREYLARLDERFSNFK